jgi:hypothetical protein
MQALEQHMFEWATPRLVSYQLEHHTYSPIEKTFYYQYLEIISNITNKQKDFT